MNKELNFWGKFLSIGHKRPILLSKIYQQDVLTNWRCHCKFCFLFWLLFAEMLRHPLQFFFLSVQNLNVIPISCPRTVCLFHKTDMGGGTTISYCGKLSITHLLWRHAKISEFRYNKKCCQNFRGQRMISEFQISFRLKSSFNFWFDTKCNIFADPLPFQ